MSTSGCFIFEDKNGNEIIRFYNNWDCYLSGAAKQILDGVKDVGSLKALIDYWKDHEDFEVLDTDEEPNWTAGADRIYTIDVDKNTVEIYGQVYTLEQLQDIIDEEGLNECVAHKSLNIKALNEQLKKYL